MKTEKMVAMNSGDSARVGDVAEVAVQDLGEGGEGIGKLPDGITCFVPGLLPGESGKVRISVRKKNYATAKLLERTFTSKDRVEPHCPYFEECGGCQIMHLKDEAQLGLKRVQVEQALKRISGIAAEVPPLIPSPSVLAYRNKLSLPVKGTSREPFIGFYKRGSHHVVDIAKCRVGLMAHEGILKTLKEWIAEKRIPLYVEKIGEGLLRHVVIRSSRDGKKIMVVLVVREEEPVLRSAAQLFFNREGLPSREVTSLYLNVNEEEGNAILGKKSMLLGGEAWIVEQVAGLSSHAGPDSFSQLNPAVAEKLYLHVAEAVPENTKSLVDLYCGAGILSLLLAKKIAAAGGKVVGIESSGISIELAGVNRHENKVENARFVRSDARVGFEKLLKEGAPEVVILNPPRSGVEKELLEGIAEAGVGKIIYVSCKASTLARDLGILASRGYKLVKIQSFDMLPQTTHVESVAVIEKI